MNLWPHSVLIVALAGAVATPVLGQTTTPSAGSAGGGYFCHRQMQTHLRRVLDGLPTATIIAPGHGPMTTVENELRYNPFLG